MKNKKSNIKICFLADKHELFDDRIYWKMAVPLKERGFNVHYLLIGNIEGKGVTKEGIHYEVLKVKTFSKNKYFNFLLKNLNPFNNYSKLFRKAKIINADIYHFHDLWINKIGWRLTKLRQKPVVFYDAREPYAEDYISYTNGKGLFKKIIIIFAYFVNLWEKRKSKKYDLVITNEEIVRDKFREVLGKDKAEVLYNYTDNYKLYDDREFSKKSIDFIYSGGVTELRGAFKILEATLIAKECNPDIKVVFVGKFSPAGLKDELQNYIIKNKLSKNVELHPFVNYSQISEYYNKSKVGFITPLPMKSFKIKMFIKIFEYMAFGMPIIGSDFGHIKEYIELENCGIIIDPCNTKQIADAMTELLSNLDKYYLFSKNGREASMKKYKWDFEFERLVNYYQRSLDKRDL